MGRNCRRRICHGRGGRYGFECVAREEDERKGRCGHRDRARVGILVAFYRRHVQRALETAIRGKVISQRLQGMSDCVVSRKA